MNAPIHVIADDITGAAEIAAIGHDRGLRTVVQLPGCNSAQTEADLIVIDTDSRLVPASEAGQRVHRALESLRLRPNSIVFKKVDSVLRGNIAAELSVLMRPLGREAALLCPCNPTRGRCIRHGRYLVSGIPLHLTDFSRDPHHPAHSDEVARLLAASPVPVHVHDSADASTTLPQLPPGINVGSAESVEDLADWAAHGGEALPAGGADFFRAFLDNRGVPQGKAPQGCSLQAPHLLLCGTVSNEASLYRRRARALGVPIVELPVFTENPALLAAAIDEIEGSLAEKECCIAATSERRQAVNPAKDWLEHCFAECASSLLSRGAVGHLMAEGGATAAAVASRLGWHRLLVAGSWPGGVVTLRPEQAPALRLTIKPGSYTWPFDLPPAPPGA